MAYAINTLIENRIVFIFLFSNMLQIYPRRWTLCFFYAQRNINFPFVVYHYSYYIHNTYIIYLLLCFFFPSFFFKLIYVNKTSLKYHKVNWIDPNRLTDWILYTWYCLYSYVQSYIYTCLCMCFNFTQTHRSK